MQPSAAHRGLSELSQLLPSLRALTCLNPRTTDSTHDSCGHTPLQLCVVMKFHRPLAAAAPPLPPWEWSSTALLIAIRGK